ncbi:hypothetical protein GCM10009530_04470 [Microbispora corallina]|uniref:Uncharacterized protein n=1 Tax=Microbispora corallina TaxID=83302 RepID=A0ABQ4FRB0_9ACTN|nr:hypothetical protein Mco01_03260 [Microbispora corallina]
MPEGAVPEADGEPPPPHAASESDRTVAADASTASSRVWSMVVVLFLSAAVRAICPAQLGAAYLDISYQDNLKMGSEMRGQAWARHSRASIA